MKFMLAVLLKLDGQLVFKMRDIYSEFNLRDAMPQN